jgi:hypothetical protein
MSDNRYSVNYNRSRPTPYLALALPGKAHRNSYTSDEIDASNARQFFVNHLDWALGSGVLWR